MPTADTIIIGDKIHAMLYGAPKAGKTFFAATWPRPGFLDVDHGLKVVRSPAFREKHPDVDLAKIKYELADDEVDPATGIVSRADGFKEAMRQLNKLARDPDVETIVLDSLTALSRLAMNAGLIAQSKGARPRSMTFAEAKRDGVILLAKQDFGAEMSAVEQVLDMLMAVDKHVLVVAHEREERTDSGTLVGISPLITGDRLRAKIARWFDDVWYIEKEVKDGKVIQTLVTEADKKLRAVGSRLGLPAEITDPSYTKIQQLLRSAA
jgi:hypothetical protein